MDLNIEARVPTNIGGVVSGTGSGIVLATKTQLLTSANASSVPSSNTLMLLDGNANSVANNFVTASTNIVSTGGSTALSLGSTSGITVSGTLNQTIVLPNATLLSQGNKYRIVNNSTGIVTVTDFGGNVLLSILQNLNGNGVRVFSLSDKSTSAGVWSIDVPSVSGRIALLTDVQIGTLRVRASLAGGVGFLVTAVGSVPITVTGQSRNLLGATPLPSSVNAANIVVSNVTPTSVLGLTTAANTNNAIVADLFDITNGKTYELRLQFTSSITAISLMLKA